MRYRIELVDDLMHVLDDDGNGYDAHVVRRAGLDAAERKIDEWAGEYHLDPERAKGVPPDRISFIAALRWLATAEPGEELPELNVLPSRPERIEPRVRKRRPKEYTLMTRPRQELLAQALGA